MSRWARRRQEATGKAPTLWLVRRSLPLSLPPLTTRITCMCTLAIKSYAPYRTHTGQGVHRPEQHPAVARLLARLPRGLPDAARRGRAHVGPTYCSRLWCVMELFTFARSEPIAFRTLLDRSTRRLTVWFLDRTKIESRSNHSYIVLGGCKPYVRTIRHICERNPILHKLK